MSMGRKRATLHHDECDEVTVVLVPKKRHVV